jgi:collagenase-like PrtC family protease
MDPGNLRERNVRTVGEFFARLEAMDVDGVITDDPGILRATLPG